MLDGQRSEALSSTLAFEITRGDEGGYWLKLNGDFVAARSSLAEALFWLGGKMAERYRETPYVQHAPMIAAPAPQPQPQPQPAPQPVPPAPYAQPPATPPPPVSEVERFPRVATGPDADVQSSLLDKITNRMYDARRSTSIIAAWAISLALYTIAMAPHA